MVKKRKVEPTGKFKVVMIGREKFYLVKPKLFKKIMKTSLNMCLTANYVGNLIIKTHQFF